MASQRKRADSLVSTHRLNSVHLNLFMNNSIHPSIRILCEHGALLMDNAHALVVRLQREANKDFDYSRAVGPHLRHVMDHYGALITAIHSNGVIDYDKRKREPLIQTDMTAAKERLKFLASALRNLSFNIPAKLEPTLPVTTIFKSGPVGEYEVETNSTLGRELIFVSHHAVHHFAVLTAYCEKAGLVMDHDFGKAPATVAYEKQLAQSCA